jgi:hypothetical protein
MPAHVWLRKKLRIPLGTVVFPKIVGRSYGFRTLPLALQPAPVDTVSKPLPMHTSQPDEISEPGSRRLIDSEIAPSPGRSYLAHTEDTLNLGPVPDRIDRETPAANRGKIGVGAGPVGIAGWPYDGKSLFIPHQSIPRKPITGAVFSRTIDTSATIPSTPIGSPVG